MPTQLKTMRLKKGHTQVDMALMLDISVRQYQRYEAAQLTPPVKVGKKIAHILNVKIEDIFTD